MTELTQVKAHVAELAATAQQTPARNAVDRLQHNMRSVEASLQQVQSAQTDADRRWQTVEAAVLRLDTMEQAVHSFQYQQSAQPADNLQQRVSLQVWSLVPAILICLNCQNRPVCKTYCQELTWELKAVKYKRLAVCARCTPANL